MLDVTVMSNRFDWIYSKVAENDGTEIGFVSQETQSMGNQLICPEVGLSVCQGSELLILKCFKQKSFYQNTCLWQANALALANHDQAVC